MISPTAAHAVQSSVVWGGFRVWQRNRDAFLRAWKVEIGGIAIEPIIMFVAIGFGLGAYIQDIGELSYAEFLAPGVIASYAMFHATYDSAWGAYLRMETHHVYEAVLFTPLGPEDIVVGEVMWSATRAAVSSTAVLAVAAAFGLVSSPLAVLVIPCAYLIGVAIASISMVFTATVTTIGALTNYFTLFILPMFYVSGPGEGSGHRRAVLVDAGVGSRAGAGEPGRPPSGGVLHAAQADKVTRFLTSPSFRGGE